MTQYGEVLPPTHPRAARPSQPGRERRSPVGKRRLRAIVMAWASGLTPCDDGVGLLKRFGLSVVTMCILSGLPLEAGFRYLWVLVLDLQEAP